MAAKDANDGCDNLKLTGNASTLAAGVSSNSTSTNESECGLTISLISAGGHTECTTPSGTHNESNLSQMLSKTVLDKWNSLFPPTPKTTIESILGEESDVVSTGDAKNEVTHKSSSRVEDVDVHSHDAVRNSASKSFKKKKAKKPTKRQPCYPFAMPDTRNLSDGATAITAAEMASEYDDIWKEIQMLILSENTRLKP